MDKRAVTSAENGKKGGRPIGSTTKPRITDYFTGDDVALMAQQAKDMTINAEKPDKDIFKLLWNDLFGLPLRRTELTGAEGEALKILFDNSFGGNDSTR